MSQLSGLGNGVKRPHKLAGTNTKRTNHAAGALGGILRNCGSGNDQIPINGRGRCHGIFRVWISVRGPCAQIDHAVLAKIAAWFTGLRIQRNQAPIESAQQNSTVVACLALPVGNPAVLKEFALSATPGLWIKLPDLLAALRIER